jgi:alkylhydroperoxidase/carboxymuconolactone decarboxylase family protein YurZ
MSNRNSHDAGVEVMCRLFGRKPDRAHLPEQVFEDVIGSVYGDVWTRPGLTLQERSLFTVTSLVAQGRSAELELHVLGARNLGVPREKLEELMIHLAVYCGWPSAMQGFRAIQRVYDKAAPQASTAR